MAQQKPIAQPIAQSLALRKEALINQLASSRQEITSERAVLKSRLNPKTRLRRFFTKNPKRVVIGSAVTGLVLTSLFRSKRRVGSVRKKGVVMTLVGWCFTLAKPSIKSLLIKQATSMAAKRINQRANSLHPDQ